MAGRPNGISISGQLNPHNITERQGPRKQKLEEQNRVIRKAPSRTRTTKTTKSFRRKRG